MQRALPVLLAATILAACAESPVVGPDAGRAVASRAASSRTAPPSRPAGGTCTLVGRAILPPLPGQPANVTRRQLEHVCQLRHLGRTTAISTEAGTFTGSGVVVTGITVYTAANGDQLFVSYSGTATLPDQSGLVTFIGTETVTGGTGRFAGASGALTRTATLSVLILSGQYETSGTLSY